MVLGTKTGYGADMDFSRNEGPAHLLVQRIEAGAITIGGLTYRQSVLLTPDGVVEWAAASIDDVAAGGLDALLEYLPEIVLLGTGERLRFPDPVVQRPLLEQGIGLEVMDTAAACRTFNLLLSERRRVLAALLIEDQHNV